MREKQFGPGKHLPTFGPDGTPAWQDPATRLAWWRTVLFRCGMLLGSMATMVLWLMAVVFTPPWLLVLWLPVVLVLLYPFMLSLAHLFRTRRIRRVLRVYPWQAHHGVAQLASNGTTRFVLPSPDQPEKTVTLRYGNYLGSGFTFWVREVKAERVDEVWFAGDPRFLAVVAVPGPRRLLALGQPEATNPSMAPRRKGVSPEAKERARAAGARVG